MQPDEKLQGRLRRKGLKILALENRYNKRVPPVGTTGREVNALKPVVVNVSMILYKVVAILLLLLLFPNRQQTEP